MLANNVYIRKITKKGKKSLFTIHNVKAARKMMHIAKIIVVR